MNQYVYVLVYQSELYVSIRISWDVRSKVRSGEGGGGRGSIPGAHFTGKRAIPGVPFSILNVHKRTQWVPCFIITTKLRHTLVHSQKAFIEHLQVLIMQKRAPCESWGGGEGGMCPQCHSHPPPLVPTSMRINMYILTFSYYSMYKINMLVCNYNVINTVHIMTPLFKTHRITFNSFAICLQSIVQVIVFCQLIKML